MRDLVEEQRRDVESGGYDESASFTINATAKAFRILIDGLYSDKPRAIIRELFANAYDSHVAAGIPDTAFYCRLPSRFDTTFCVRDFGVSLTHKQVMNLYTTMFMSTKDAENISVGKFGLGAKTPFAYTDSFTAAAVMDGKKRIYNCFIDPEGVPKIALFAEFETDEAQGFEVSFPIKNEDINTFNKAAERVLMGFDVPPIIYPNTDMVKDLSKQVKISGPSWRIYKESSEFEGLQVRQGCVVYPLDISVLLRDVAINAPERNTVKILQNMAMVIDMPIGSVEITPSREALSYNAPTIANLLEALKPIAGAIVAKATSTITTAPTRLKAQLAMHKITIETYSNSMVQAIRNEARWNGRPITEGIVVRQGITDKLKLFKMRRNGDSDNFRFEDAHTHWSVLNRPVIFYYTSEQPPPRLQDRLKEAVKNQPILHSPHYILARNFNAANPAFRRLVAKWGDFDDLMEHMVCIDDYEYTDADMAGLLKHVSIFNAHPSGVVSNFRKPKNLQALLDAVKDVPVYIVYRGRTKIAFRRNRSVQDITLKEFPSFVIEMQNMGALERHAVILSMPLGRGVKASAAARSALPSDWQQFDEVGKKAGQMLKPEEVFNRSLSYNIKEEHDRLYKTHKFIVPLIKMTDSPLREIVKVGAELQEKLQARADHPSRAIFDRLMGINHDYIRHLREPPADETIEKTIEDAGHKLRKLYPLFDHVSEDVFDRYGDHRKKHPFLARYIDLEDQVRRSNPEDSDLFFNISVP